MQNLSLTEIAPYLPFGLKVKNLNHKIDYVGKEYGEVNGFYPLYKDGQPIWHYTTTENSTGAALSDCLPLLFPISSLTKPMDDGRVPLIECAKITKPSSTWSLSIDGCANSDDEFGFSFDGRDFELWKTHTGILQPIYNQLALFQELAKMHIDFQGLIERGLAIDATTLPVNPYSSKH